MRNSVLLLLLICALVKLQAQNYLISFSGSGASTTTDSVIVENLTQGTSMVVESGYQLQLLGALSTADPGSAGSAKSLLVYPNPSGGEAILVFEAISNAQATIELSDMSGRLVATKQAFLSAGSQSFRICGLNTGSYAVQIRSEGYLLSGKIISRSCSGKPIQIYHSGQPSIPSVPKKIKNSAAIVQMQYTSGDLLKFTGNSGIYATLVMDIPTSNKTITFAFSPCTDYDSNQYAIVEIGSQTWMAENLKSVHYHDGTPAAYYDYDHDPDNSLIYGRLYSWPAAMNAAQSSNTNPSNVQGVCMNGWHLPSEAEWQQLAGYLGGSNVAGGKLKETGTTHWIIPNTGATDETGFSSLPAGMWAFWDEFQWKENRCAFSTSTGNLAMIEVTAMMLQTANGILTFGTFHPDDAISVRCVKN